MASDRTRGKYGGVAIAGGFARLPNAYFRTPEFAALSGRAVKLLIEFALQYNGKNNGDLSMARSTMKARGFNSADQLMKARDELIAAGWIMLTRQGGRHVASLYAITWEAIDGCGGKLDVKAGPPRHLWKPSEARYRETRPAQLNRKAEHIEPPRSTKIDRHAEH